MIPRFHNLIYITFFALFALCTILLVFILPEGSHLADFFSSGLEVIPLLIIIVLARVGSRYRYLGHVSLLLSICLVWILGLITWIMMIIPVFGGMNGEVPDLEVLSDDDLALVFWSMSLCILGSFCATLPYFSRIRRFICRYLSLSASSFPHTSSLIIVTGFLIIPVIPLCIIGQPVYAGLLKDPDFLLFFSAINPISDIYSLFWMIFIAFIAAGLFINRDLSGTISRLGLKWPTVNEFILSVVAGCVLVPVFFLMDEVIQAVFFQLGIPLTDGEYYSTLFSGYMTPVAIIVGSITAGIGEELGMRGLLQPRYGIILTALVFATLHAFQYNFDGVLSVFLAGLIFGLLRKRWHTTFSAVTHAVYDLVLMVMMMFGILTL